jgi:fructokinase
MTPPAIAPGPARHAIGVDVGGTKIEAIVLDPDGVSLWRQRVATPASDYAATVACVAALVARAESELGLSGCSVGVGTPGTQTSAGLIKNANSTCLNARPLADDLARAIGRDVRLANDANCLALSEATDGAAAGAAVAFAVILGTGVGAGVAVHGRLLVGPNGLAGEWGHNPLPWADADERGGAACFCGQQGCIETWLSGPSVARDHLQHTGQRLTAQSVGQRAADGDCGCQATLRRFESRLARALAQVINLLDPDVIVLAGGVSALPNLTRNVPQLWHRHVFGAQGPGDVRTRLVLSQHSDSSGVRGAAWLWRTGQVPRGPFVAPPRA